MKTNSDKIKEACRRFLFQKNNEEVRESLKESMFETLPPSVDGSYVKAKSFKDAYPKFTERAMARLGLFLSKHTKLKTHYKEPNLFTCLMPYRRDVKAYLKGEEVEEILKDYFLNPCENDAREVSNLLDEHSDDLIEMDEDYTLIDPRLIFDVFFKPSHPVESVDFSFSCLDNSIKS